MHTNLLISDFIIMNNIKIKTTNKKTLITVVLNFIMLNTCCCTLHQKMARGLKFRIKEIEVLHCLCIENKGDQLRGSDREANLRLCSRICKNQVFSRGSIIDKLTGGVMHKNRVKQGNKIDIVRGIASKVLNIFKTIFE